MLSQFTCARVRMLDWLAAYMLLPPFRFPPTSGLGGGAK
jgi:hypothetical protein